MKRTISAQLATIKIAAIIFTGTAMTSLSGGAAQACACCDSYSVNRVAHWDVLNVRSGPGVRFQVIGGLKPTEGCIWKSGERRGNWVRIFAAESDQKGWVNQRYLRYRSGY